MNELKREKLAKQYLEIAQLLDADKREKHLRGMGEDALRRSLRSIKGQMSKIDSGAHARMIETNKARHITGAANAPL